MHGIWLQHRSVSLSRDVPLTVVMAQRTATCRLLSVFLQLWWKSFKGNLTEEEWVYISKQSTTSYRCARVCQCGITNSKTEHFLHDINALMLADCRQQFAKYVNIRFDLSQVVLTGSLLQISQMYSSTSSSWLEEQSATCNTAARCISVKLWNSIHCPHHKTESWQRQHIHSLGNKCCAKLRKSVKLMTWSSCNHTDST